MEKYRWEEMNCDLMNEEACEEDLGGEGISLEDAEGEMFGE